MLPLASELAAARAACRRVAELQLQAFRRPDSAVDTKPDGTPVTAIDRLSEELLHGDLLAATPGLGFLGEEFGAVGSTRDRWVVDPLDGTKNFVAGLPFFAVLVALELAGKRRLGVVHAPALGETWWAVRGQGAFASRHDSGSARRLRVSTCREAARARLVCGELGLFTRRGDWSGLGRLVEGVGEARGYGDFWGHLLVAEGRAEIMVDPLVAYHDLAAVEVIVHESGGTLETTRGSALAAGFSGPAVSSNGALGELVTAALGTLGAEPAVPRMDLEFHDLFR